MSKKRKISFSNFKQNKLNFQILASDQQVIKSFHLSVQASSLYKHTRNKNKMSHRNCEKELDKSISVQPVLLKANFGLKFGIL